MIRSITLSNFRCFEGQDIEFSGLRTAIVGPNGAGKSSIQDALAYLVTGACRGTTVDGKGLDAVVRQGEETMEVRALVEGIGEVSRGIGRRMVSRGAQKGEYVAEPILERAGELLGLFGGSRRIFDLAVRPDAFAALHGREQAEALMALGGIQELTLEALLAAGCPKTVSRYRQHLDGTLAGFLAAQKAAYSDRLEAQRGAETARGAYETAQGEASAYDADQHAQDGHELAEVRERVGRLQRDDDRSAAEHRGRKAELERRASNLQKRAGDLQAASKTVDVAALIAERADLAKEAESLRKMAGGKCASELAAEISLLRGRRNETADQVRGQVAGIRDELAEIEAKLATVQAQLQDCPEPGPMPIVARQDIARIAQLTDLLSGIDDLEEIECDRCGSTLEVEELQATLAELQEATATDRAAHAEWEQKRSARADLAVAVETGTARVNGLRSTLAEAEQKLAMVVEAEALEAPLAAARQADTIGLRIAQLDADIAAAEADPKRKAQLQEARAEAKRAAAELEELGEYVPAHAEEIRQSTE
ncbi:MAG TPA: AAA family ATPase, partial [Thermoanaerobaculales bacterium]|nr:AAA family ATPase [Thermoanaerobaculales bacterium]